MICTYCKGEVGLRADGSLYIHNYNAGTVIKPDLKPCPGGDTKPHVVTRNADAVMFDTDIRIDDSSWRSFERPTTASESLEIRGALDHALATGGKSVVIEIAINRI